MPPAPDPDGPLRLQRLERVLEASRDGYWERDLRSGEIWYSPGFLDMLGLHIGQLGTARGDATGRVHPDDRQRFVETYETAIRGLGRFEYEVRFRDGAERWRWVRGRGRVWPGADGRPGIVCGAVTDVHREKTTQLALEQLMARFERALAAADEALFERWVDDDASLFMSDRGFELLGYAPGEIESRTSVLRALLHPDDAAGLVEAAATAIERGERLERDFRLRCRSGEYRWFRQRSVVDVGGDGRRRVTGMISDIHDQVLALQQLAQHRQQLESLVAERTAGLETALALAEERRQDAERANAAKSRFLAHMSHEIRTPLNGVLGLTELALRGPLQADQRRYLEVAAQSGQSLLRVISDVLDFSRIEAGRVELRPQPLDLPRLLADTIRGVMPLVNSEDVLLMFDYIGEAECVVADAGALRQIATNLLGNAAKFTDQGHITLTAQTRAVADDRVEVTLIVADSGPGIAAERRASVFEAFEQADDSLARSHGGTGLGLAIARTLAQAMGGTIGVDCPDSGGSVFTLALELPRAPEPARPPPVATGLAWLLHSQPLGAQWLGRRLARLGWRHETLPDITQAIDVVRTQPGRPLPRLVLIAEGGLATARAELGLLRAALPDAVIRLLVRSDWHDPDTEALAQQLGIAALEAPLTPATLRLALGDMATPEAASSPGAGPPLRRDAEVLLVEDNPVNQLIGSEFLQTLGLRVRVASDGEAAIAMCLERAPALVLMDLQMPVLDGLQATARLRELQRQRRWSGAPIIALTAHASDADRGACLAAGMDGVMTKPLSLATLQRQLARWLGA